MTGDGLRDTWALLDGGPRVAADKPRLGGLLQRLCRAAAGALPATGVGVSVLSGTGSQVTAFGSSTTAEEIEELQFVLGEGPCLAAYDSGRPVLVPDLATAGRLMWPGYAPAAQGHGIAAVFAFPLRVGASRLGALDVYQASAGPLLEDAQAIATDFAEVAMQTLLNARDEPEERGAVPIEEVLAGRPDVYQAQGMLTIQLGVGLDEAMSRLRAYAFASERRIEDVAADIVARRLQIGPDDE